MLCSTCTFTWRVSCDRSSENIFPAPNESFFFLKRRVENLISRMCASCQLSKGLKITVVVVASNPKKWSNMDDFLCHFSSMGTHNCCRKNPPTYPLFHNKAKSYIFIQFYSLIFHSMYVQGVFFLTVFFFQMGLRVNKDFFDDFRCIYKTIKDLQYHFWK